MDTGIATRKTNRGVLLNYVDKKQKHEKDEHIKHPTCRSKKVHFPETILPDR